MSLVEKISREEKENPNDFDFFMSSKIWARDKSLFYKRQNQKMPQVSKCIIEIALA
jgi:hypothetical protein